MELVKQLEQSYRKPAISPVRSGDTVRVHHLIKEGSKQRIQVFEGVVIRVRRQGELTADVTVRRIASGVGVEKTFLLHSPNVSKIEILRRSKVRRNFLSYLRERRGKSARLQEVAFDKAAANASNQPAAADEVEVTDEVITEIDPVVETEAAVVESTEDLAKAENAAAASEDDTEATGDENELAAQETAAGVESVDTKDDPAAS